MNLPALYREEVHKSRLDQVVREFSWASGPLGPLCNEYRNRLIEECESIWNKGRRQCNAISVTDRPCVLPMHDTSQQHASDFIRQAACNCGKTIVEIPDSFDKRTALCSISLESSCCSSSPNLMSTVRRIFYLFERSD